MKTSFNKELRQHLSARLARLSPKQRQFVTLGAILAGGIGLLWMVFAFTDTKSALPTNRQAAGAPSDIKNLGVMTPGQQVTAEAQWVGTAGRKLAQYENDREEQGRLNKDRAAFESQAMKRFSDLEQKLTAANSAATAAAAMPPVAPQASLGTASAPSSGAMPPAAGLPPPPPPTKVPSGAMPSGMPGQGPATTLPFPAPLPTVSPLTRVNVSHREPSSAKSESGSGSPAAVQPNTSTFLPVSFTRGRLLGGLDAPTGGQAQSNPHPVLIQLMDNTVLPNRFRAEYRDCFVVAAGYGDISSERAYLRTESLSCVRLDGKTLEVKIQGSVYGEDGKVGMRGRLVTKQGQMLANALLAGVVSGIGQGLSTSSTEYTTSALGTLAQSSGKDAYRNGIGTGVGRALDRLAQYYIKLAENTFPVIEVDAGRDIDVVITKGVRIDTPVNPGPDPSLPTERDAALSPDERYLEDSRDEAY